MNTILLLFIAIVPIFLIGLYIYNKDNEKEPKKLLISLFLCGMLSCIPALGLELFLGSFFGEEETLNYLELFLYVLVTIAFCEELCKWLVVYLFTYKNKEFDHIYDAIVYCIFVTLGFAIVENILYVYLGGFTVGVVRAVSAIPGHAAYAIIMANYYSRARVASLYGMKTEANKLLLLSIIIPILAHAVYDFLLFTEKFVLLIGFAIFLAFICKYSYNKIKELSSIKNNIV